MRIKCISRAPTFASNYYRSYGVLSKIYHLDPTIHVDCEPIKEWADFMQYDVLYLERPQTNEDYQLLEVSKLLGLKIYIDFDDDIFNWPPYHPAIRDKEQYNGRRQIVANSLKIADLVTVSTESIYNSFKHCNPNIHIIPNAINDYNNKLPAQPSRNKHIMWRGGETHQKDLYDYELEILQTAEKTKDWIWWFVGHDGFEERKLCEMLYDWHPWTDACKYLLPNMPLINFFISLQYINPAIIHVPLEFIPFNEAKSNLNWLDATLAGGCCVGPDMPEFRKPGIETYKTPQEYSGKILMLVDDEKKRIKNYYDSYDYITDNLLLSKVNKQRLELIRENLC